MLKDVTEREIKFWMEKDEDGTEYRLIDYIFETIPDPKDLLDYPRPEDPDQHAFEIRFFPDGSITIVDCESETRPSQVALDDWGFLSLEPSQVVDLVEAIRIVAERRAERQGAS